MGTWMKQEWEDGYTWGTSGVLQNEWGWGCRHAQGWHGPHLTLYTQSLSSRRKVLGSGMAQTGSAQNSV